MPLTQKNVKIPSQTWNRLRSNAQATGVPVCVFLTHLIDTSRPIAIDDAETHRRLQHIEEARGRELIEGPTRE